MPRQVKLNHLDVLLSELDYPCSRETAAEEFQDVTIQLADGTENLGDQVDRSTADEFASVDELSSEVMNLLPQHAVGEPYQSEGEG